MKLLDILKNFKDRIFGSKTPRLTEAKYQGEPSVDEIDKTLDFSEQIENQIKTHESFVSSLKSKTELSPEQQAELSRKDAYACLANMVTDYLFDDRAHFGESFEKSQYRLQLEDHYKNYIHSSESSENLVPETHIIVAREIQRSLYERTKFVDSYGLIQDNELLNFLGTHKLDLEAILAQNNGAFFEQISNRFMSKGQHFIDFNTMDTRSTAIESMHQAIMEALEAHVQEQQHDRM